MTGRKSHLLSSLSNALTSLTQTTTTMATWSNEDTLKLFLFTLFILAFVVVIQQLLKVDAKVAAKEKTSDVGGVKES